MRDIEKELNEARRDANNATRYAEPGYANLTAYAQLLEIRALRLTIEKATQKLHEHHRGTWVRFTDHEAAIEQVLADAKARIEGERIESRPLIFPRPDGMDSWENGYHVGIEAALAALTQPQTEIEGKPDGTWYDIPDGGGAATAAGVADADLVRVGDFFGIPAFTHPDVKPGIVGIVSAGEVTATITGTAPQEAQADPKWEFEGDPPRPPEIAPVPQTEGECPAKGCDHGFVWDHLAAKVIPCPTCSGKEKA